MSTKIKDNLVVIAKADSKDDAAFYQLILKSDSYLRQKARVYIFPTVEDFDAFLQLVESDFNFYLVVHTGFNASNPSVDRIVFENHLTKLGYYGQLNYYFASREGAESFKNNDTIYALEFGFPEFEFEKYKSNTKSDLLKSVVPDPGAAAPGMKEKDTKFAILTALFKDEHEAFDNHMKTEDIPGKNLKKGSFLPTKDFSEDYTGDLVLAWQQDMGSVDAAAFSAMLIYNYNPKFLIMGGVCGGREGEVKLYDVIIPKNIQDYMSGKFAKGEFIPRPLPAEPNPQLIGHLIKKEDVIMKNMRALATEQVHKNILNNGFKIHFKNYACGPWVVKTKDALLEIAKATNDDIIGLEMESLGLIRACNLFADYSKYGLVVKSVMDFTDENKSDGDKGTIKSTAASISYLCIRAMLPVLLEFRDSRSVV
jgi:nucleoside phosphorylase/YHS domain-containing protein